MKRALKARNVFAATAVVSLAATVLLTVIIGGMLLFFGTRVDGSIKSVPPIIQNIVMVLNLFCFATFILSLAGHLLTVLIFFQRFRMSLGSLLGTVVAAGACVSMLVGTDRAPIPALGGAGLVVIGIVILWKIAAFDPEAGEARSSGQNDDKER